MYHCNQYLQYEERRGVWHSSIDWPRRHAHEENGYRCCYCHADIHALHQNRKTIAILTLNLYGHYISWHSSGTPADYDSGTAKNYVYRYHAYVRYTGMTSTPNHQYIITSTPEYYCIPVSYIRYTSKYDLNPQLLIHYVILLLLYTCATLNVRCGLAVHTKILRSK